MIDHALSIIVKHLSSRLQSPETSHEPIHEAAVLMNATDLSGQPRQAQNSIVVSVVNIGEEIVPTAMRRPRANLQGPTPLNLNIRLLVAADFSSANYVNGLNALGRAMDFFHTNPVFNHTNSPDIAAHGLQKLSLELDGMESDSVSRFWNAVGGGYQPCVFYRLRMLSVGHPQGLGKVSPVTHVTEIGEL